MGGIGSEGESASGSFIAEFEPSSFVTESLVKAMRGADTSAQIMWPESRTRAFGNLAFDVE